MSNNSTPSKIKAKLGLHGVLDSEVVKTLTVAYNGLLHNPAFPNTPVDLAIYKVNLYLATVEKSETGSIRNTGCRLCAEFRRSTKS